MKTSITSIFLFFIVIGSAQVANYNHFPTMQPTHILDENLDNISFALGLRILVSDYNGPLIRLRRGSDNSEMDFFCSDNDEVDIAAIDLWRGTSNVFVVTWYDQSGLGRNAVQPTTNKQPRFYPDVNNPYFQGDGLNDNLDINTSIQVLTNAGAAGTILGVFNIVANRRSNLFGSYASVNSGNRWAAHANWSDGNVYFDPGRCCNNPRRYSNSANLNDWDSYTFIRSSNTTTARVNGVTQFNGVHLNGRCTSTNDFGILYANGSNNLYSNAQVAEFIMYNTNILATQYEEIESNQITFWNL